MIWLWAGFLAFIAVLLVLDLGILHRKNEAVPAKSALKWVAFFVLLGALFNVGVYFIYENNWLNSGERFSEQIRRFEAAKLVSAGKLPADMAATWTPPPESAAAKDMSRPGRTAAVQFLTGWLTEYSLSVDNIFVIALIFTHFRVAPKYQHRVLFWGILGALAMRGAMILTGTALIARFHWLIYLFGAFLIFTAIKMVLAGDGGEVDFENRRIIRWARKLIPMSPTYHGSHFFTRIDGRLMATPMLLVLLVVETTDVIFALDSIPAILGITTDPFLVFTSNVFAILGLRSLFFALSGLMDKFHYLKYSLALILGFVGAKMLLEVPAIGVEISSTVSLMVIGGVLAMGVIASLAHAGRAKSAELPDVPQEH